MTEPEPRIKRRVAGCGGCATTGGRAVCPKHGRSEEARLLAELRDVNARLADIEATNRLLARVAAPSDGLREAVAVVIHRWKHPTYRIGEQGCRCEAEAEMAVDVAQPELAALATTGQPEHYADCPKYLGEGPCTCPAQPEDTRTADPGGLPSVTALSIALQRAGALSDHITYHDLARCVLAALTDGADHLGAPDEHRKHAADTFSAHRALTPEATAPGLTAAGGPHDPDDCDCKCLRCWGEAIEDGATPEATAPGQPVAPRTQRAIDDRRAALNDKESGG